MSKHLGLRIARHDMRQTAFHEAGHLVAARYFGLDAWGHIERIGQPTVDSKAYVGKATHAKTTKFRAAVIAWAGPIAVEILADPSLELWDYEMTMVEDLGGFDEFSDTDRAAINCHPQRIRSLRTAWRILKGRWKDVVNQAKDFMYRTQHGQRSNSGETIKLKGSSK